MTNAELAVALVGEAAVDLPLHQVAQHQLTEPKPNSVSPSPRPSSLLVVLLLPSQLQPYVALLLLPSLLHSPKSLLLFQQTQNTLHDISEIVPFINILTYVSLIHFKDNEIMYH